MFKWARNSSSQKFITQKTVPFENVYIITKIMYTQKRRRRRTAGVSQARLHDRNIEAGRYPLENLLT